MVNARFGAVFFTMHRIFTTGSKRTHGECLSPSLIHGKPDFGLYHLVYHLILVSHFQRGKRHFYHLTTYNWSFRLGLEVMVKVKVFFTLHPRSCIYGIRFLGGKVVSWPLSSAGSLNICQRKNGGVWWCPGAVGGYAWHWTDERTDWGLVAFFVGIQTGRAGTGTSY